MINLSHLFYPVNIKINIEKVEDLEQLMFWEKVTTGELEFENQQSFGIQLIQSFVANALKRRTAPLKFKYVSEDVLRLIK